MNRDWDAAAYHRVSDPQFAWGLRVLERARVNGDEHALDAGCGSGRLTAELVRRLPDGRVVGADLSESMVHGAAAALAAEVGSGGVARCDIVCANLVELPFRARFDLVFSTATFHWIRDHRALFVSLHDVLRPGGRLEAQCGGGPNLAHAYGRATSIMGTAQFREHMDGWTEPWEFASAETTERRLRDAGFTRTTCWLEAMPTSFASPEPYREFLEQVVMRPFLARLPTPDLRDRLLDLMTEGARHDDPPLSLDYWRLNISATRD